MIPFISVVIAGISAIYAARQVHLSKLSTATDILQKLESRFESAEMRAKREKAAEAIKDLTKDKKNRIEDVLDFFDTVGLYTKRGVLDEEMVSNTFFYWIYGWWLFSKEFISETEFANTFEDFIYIKDLTYEIASFKDKDVNLKRWDNFLEEELQI